MDQLVSQGLTAMGEMEIKISTLFTVFTATELPKDEDSRTSFIKDIFTIICKV